MRLANGRQRPAALTRRSTAAEQKLNFRGSAAASSRRLQRLRAPRRSRRSRWLGSVPTSPALSRRAGLGTRPVPQSRGAAGTLTPRLERVRQRLARAGDSRRRRTGHRGEAGGGAGRLRPASAAPRAPPTPSPAWPHPGPAPDSLVALPFPGPTSGGDLVETTEPLTSKPDLEMEGREVGFKEGLRERVGRERQGHRGTKGPSAGGPAPPALRRAAPAHGSEPCPPPACLPTGSVV